MIQLLVPIQHVKITQPWGVNWVRTGFYSELGIPSDKHNGIDFLAFDGTPITASHDGYVTWAGEDGTGGISVNLCSSKSGEGFYTIYYHLKNIRDGLMVNDRVKAGYVIGYADNTGKSSGTHLHFGLKRTFDGATIDKGNGYGGAIDPSLYFIDRDWDKSDAFKRYGYRRTWATYLRERAVIAPLAAILGRLPRPEEVNAAVYGNWSREEIASPAMAFNWQFLTKPAFLRGDQIF